MCPVKIDIPEILIHLRRRIVEERGSYLERLAMKGVALTFSDHRWFSRAQTVGRFLQRRFEKDGYVTSAPGPLGAWTRTRDLPAMPAQSFRQWWAARKATS